MQKVARFLRFMFLGRLDKTPSRTVSISAFSLKKQPEDPTQKNQSENSGSLFIKNQTVLFVNWVFALVLGACLVAMIIYAVVYKSESIPVYISSPFSMILGWFGHAYTSFLELEKRR